MILVLLQLFASVLENAKIMNNNKANSIRAA